jgi:hypothetical protein
MDLNDQLQGSELYSRGKSLQYPLETRVGLDAVE